MFLEHCSLCNVANKLWQRGRFFGIESCDTHEGQPLIVLDDHRAKLMWDEEEELAQLIKLYYPEYKRRGKGMRSIQDHFHEHMIRLT